MSTPYRVRHGLIVDTSNNNSSIITSNNQVLTGSSSSPLLDLATTWNTTGSPTAIKLNVINTLSGANSSLLDLQLGGASRFIVAANGNVGVGKSTPTVKLDVLGPVSFSASGSTIESQSTFDFTSPSGGNSILRIRNSSIAYNEYYDFILETSASSSIIRTGQYNNLFIRSGIFGKLYLDSGSGAAVTAIQKNVNGSVGIGTDIPTAKLTISNGTSPSSEHIYGTFTDSSNYERINLTANSSGHYIISEEAGTGTARDLYLGSNNTTHMTITSSGNIGIGASPYLNARLTVKGYSVISQSDDTNSYFEMRGSNAYLGSQGPMIFATAATEKMRINLAGNIGIGTQPNVWDVGGGGRSIQFPSGSIANYDNFSGNYQLWFFNNAYRDGDTGSFRYLKSSYASYYSMNNIGQHTWWVAPSGTQGANVSFTQVMTIDNTGKVGIGTSTPATPLHVIDNQMGGLVISRPSVPTQFVQIHLSDFGSHTIVGSGSRPLHILNTPGQQITLGASGSNIGVAKYGQPIEKLEVAGNIATTNGVNATSILTYGTYTDASNYERLNFTANTTGHYIRGEEVGTGLARPLYLGANNTTHVTVSANGFVGINKSTPAVPLEIYTTSSSEVLRLVYEPGNKAELRLGFNAVEAIFAGQSRYRLDSLGYTAVHTGLYLNGGTAAIGGNGGTDVILATGTTSANLTERLRVVANGNIGIETSTPTAKLDINSNTIRVRTAKTPASATDTGNQGDICWDANYIYVCTATNTWVRASLATW